MATCAEVLGRHGLARNAECLQAHSISKCTHVLECSIIDLMELGNLTHDQALLTRDAAAAALAPPLITFTALLQHQSARRKLALGIPAIDDALQGGLLNGSITELVGPASIGKSQLCLTLAAKTAAPNGMDAAVVYIDTEMKLSEARLLHILQHKLTAQQNGSAQSPDSAEVATRARSVAQRVHVLRPASGHALMAQLRQLSGEMERRNVGLVILDSVAMLARLEYGTDQVAARQKLLAEQASLLKQAAERFGIPVVVVNQVTGGGEGAGPAGAQRAALGVVWAHAVNTRLVLDQQHHVRRVRIAKCPMAANASGAYEIGPQGVFASDIELLEAAAASVLEPNISTEHMVQAGAED